MAGPAKHLLIVYHSQGEATQRMAEAALEGASEESGVQTRLLRAGEAGLDELLWCDGLLIGSPENFGYMAGMIKDFFDRTFYPAQGKVEGLPYAVFIKCGNDGSGALNHIERIARGYPFRKVAEPILVKGPGMGKSLDLRCVDGVRSRARPEKNHRNTRCISRILRGRKPRARPSARRKRSTCLFAGPKGELTAEALLQCRELGQAMAAGLALGIF